MRIYGEDKEHELTAVICNACGKKLKVEKGILKEGCFHERTGLDISAVRMEKRIPLIFARSAMIR